mgnify:CR=1 FL=1
MQWRKDTGVKVAQACMSGNKICACKKLDTTYTPNDDAQSSYTLNTYTILGKEIFFIEKTY